MQKRIKLITKYAQPAPPWTINDTLVYTAGVCLNKDLY